MDRRFDKRKQTSAKLALCVNCNPVTLGTVGRRPPPFSRRSRSRRTVRGAHQACGLLAGRHDPEIEADDFADHQTIRATYSSRPHAHLPQTHRRRVVVAVTTLPRRSRSPAWSAPSYDVVTLNEPVEDTFDAQDDDNVVGTSASP